MPGVISACSCLRVWENSCMRSPAIWSLRYWRSSRHLTGNRWRWRWKRSKGMQSKIQVLLLGTNASVLSVFRRHRQAYLIRCLEGDDPSLSIGSEPRPHLVVLLCDNLHLCQQAPQAWPTLPLVMVSENASEQQITNALD